MNLPEMGKPFIGRQRSIDDLLDLLYRRETRIITLTGFGGFGKTTLALQVAHQVESDFEHGAVFVPLAVVLDHRQVAAHVAGLLGLVDATAARAPEQALLDHLADKELLLVLDNFEHVYEARMLVAQLRAACPNLVMLVTSRKSLNVSGEHIRELEPLGVPTVSASATADAVRGSESALLFAERAKAVRSDFAIDDRNAADVAEICRTLEGIPLAIELAAARMRSVGTRDLLRYLKPRLGIASSGPVDHDPRHHALSEMIAWSYDLLQPCQRELFQRLCIFIDGFSVEGALRVGAGDDSDPQRLLNSLAELAENHLIRMRHLPDGSSRYDMLETIIEFGLRRLTEAGELDAARRAHAGYYLELAAQAEQGIRAGDTAVWRTTLEIEQSNLRAATQWVLDHAGDDGATALLLCNQLWSYWRLRGAWPEAIIWLEAAIAAAGGAPSKQVAIAWLYLGNSIFDDQRRAQRCYEESLRLFEAIEDAGGIAVAVGSLAMLSDMMGDYERGKELNRNALARLRALDQDVRSSIAITLIVTADLEINSGHPANARPLVDEALTLWKELRDEQYIAVALWRRGRVERLVGRANDAVEFLVQSLAALRKTGDRNLEYMAIYDLGMAHLSAGRYSEAMTAFSESLTIARELQISDGTVASVLEGLARLRVQLGRDDEAVRVFAAADRLRTRSATPIPLVEQQQIKRDLKAARRKLGVSYESHWTIGGTLGEDDAVALALAPIAIVPPAKRPSPEKRDPVSGLTPREREILCELVKGRSDREIGEALGIAESTARTLVQRVREKLSVTTRQAAAMIAIESGWCIES